MGEPALSGAKGRRWETSTVSDAERDTRARHLAGRHAVVTGGGRGIGAAIAEELARLGADLTLMGRDVAAVERHAAAVAERFAVRATAVRCDVSDDASVERAFADSRDRLGDAYALVNNAGQAEGARFDRTTRATWDRLLAVNLTGTFLCTQQALPAMVAARAGRVVNVASVAALKGVKHGAAYCASKHGVLGLTRALAMETAKLGVTVNAVCPGYTDTDMAAAAVTTLVGALGTTPDEARAMITRTSPRGTLVAPREVANAVGWLLSPDAGAVTGQAIVVAGGEVM